MTTISTSIPKHIIIKHDDDESAIEVSNNSDVNSITRNLPLVDEIDLQQCLISPQLRQYNASAIQGVVIGKKELEVICNASVDSTIDGIGGVGTQSTNGHPQACPCCRRYINSTSTPPASPERRKNTTIETNANESTTLSSLVEAVVNMQPTIMQPMAAPPLVNGDQIQEWTVVETRAQGWLYKKGSGADFSGQRWWKPRWVSLALAESSTTDIPKPIIISHRAPGVPYPANIVELTESTVIMAIERTHLKPKSVSSSTSLTGKNRENHQQLQQTEDTFEWNRHCFQIVHTHHQDNVTTPNTTRRIFTAPIEDRNEWVFAMNAALLDFERRLSKARNDAAKIEYLTQTKNKVRRVGSLLDDEEEESSSRQQQQTPWTKNSLERTRSSGSLVGLPPIGRTRSLEKDFTKPNVVPL